MAEAIAETERDKKIKEQKEAAYLRREQIRNIARTLKQTEQGSAEEDRILLVLDKMELSHSEWEFVCTEAPSKVSHERPRILERKIKALEIWSDNRTP